MIFNELVLSIPGIVIGTLILVRLKWLTRNSGEVTRRPEDEWWQIRLAWLLGGVGFIVISLVTVVEAML